MSSIERRILNIITRYLRIHGIPAGSKILIAYSGGPDSTALMHSLRMAASSYHFTLGCAYLDHGIRSEAEREKEESLVRAECEKAGIPVFVRHAAAGEITEMAVERGGGLEEAARIVRYSVLEELFSQWNADYIAVGHTADDQVETLMMRFFQGSGPWGLAGIPERREAVIRPLMSVTRREIVDFLKSRGAAYCTDYTNEEPIYLRNRIRIELIPLIRAVFPGFRRALKAYAEKAMLTDEFLRQEAERRIRWSHRGSTSVVDVREYYNAPPILRIWSLYSLFDIWRRQDTVEMGKDERIPYNLVRDAALRGIPDPEEVVVRAFGRRLVRRGRLLFGEPDVVLSAKKGYLYVVETEGCVNAGGVAFSVYSHAIDTSTSTVCMGRVPVVIRSRRSGDRIRTKAGVKSLKKLYNEWSVSHADRQKIPVIQDRYGIRAVVGGPLGYTDLLTIDTVDDGLGRIAPETAAAGIARVGGDTGIRSVDKIIHICWKNPADDAKWDGNLS